MKNVTALILLLVIILFVAVSCMAQTQPTSAQAVTPLPGPQATATAAAQRLSDAQAQTAAADANFNQAVINKQQTDEAYQKAQAEFANAQANLQAQQYQQAGEAIGRGNAYIETGQAQANQLFSVVTQQKSVIEAQAAQIISVTNEAQQCGVSLQNTNVAYTKQQAQLQAQIEDSKGKGDVGNYAVLFAFIMCAILLVSLVLGVLQRRREPDAPPDPPIDSEWKQTAVDEDRAEDDSARMDDENID